MSFVSRSLRIFGLLVLFAGFVPAVSAQPVLDLSGGATVATGGDAVVGWAFELTDPITIGALGFWDENPEGLLGDHAVALWTAGGVPLANTVVTNASSPEPSGSPDGRWLFEAIAPLTLTPGTYIVGATVTQAEADLLRVTTTTTTSPEVLFLAAVSQGGLALDVPPINIQPLADGIFGPNLLLANNAPIPEASGALPFALGLLIAAAALRREYAS